MPGAFKPARNESGEKKRAGGPDTNANETPNSEAVSPKPNDTATDDPIELANRLVQLLEGGESGSGNSGPAPEKPPQYVDDLSVSATKDADAPSECWYAVWLLSEGTDKEIPDTMTDLSDGTAADKSHHSETYETAVTLLDKSAQTYPPAKVIEGILKDWSFSEPADQEELKNNGDGELFYYLGKAFLNGRNIFGPELNPNSEVAEMMEQRITQNRALAFQILKFADKLGSASARLQLALMYANGLGVPKDARKAFDYASDAANRPPIGGSGQDGAAVEAFKQADRKALISQAREQLGVYYVMGLGTSPDAKKADEYIRESKAGQ
jgi:hypothetical protein